MSTQKTIIFFLFLISFLPQEYYSHSLLFYKSINTDSIESFAVKYVRSISSMEDLADEKSLGEKLIEWIFGEDNRWLIRPMSICEYRGNIFILDQGGGYLVRIDTLENDFDLILNENEALFPSLLSITVTGNGNLLFTDSRDNCLYLFDTKAKEVRSFPLDYDLKQPTGIAFNKKSNEIWIVETKRHSVAVFNERGEYLRTVGKRGTKPGEFNFPTYIWIDDDGLVYIVDSSNFRIQILNTAGKVKSVFGEAGDASGYFARPKGIALDSFGHIFVVDGLYNTIQVFDSDGNFLYYFGGKGSGEGEFWLPTGIFIDENNYIFVADSYNSRIQIFKLIKNEKK